MPVTADSLFRDFFLPLYPEDAKADLARARQEDANPAKNPSVVAHLGDAAEVFARNAPVVLGAPESELALDFSDASVHRLSKALTAARRDKLAGNGKPGTSDSALFNFVVHGAAYLGACIVRGHGGIWQVRRPLWESLVRLESRAGEADLPVFHWLLKSLADDAEGGTPMLGATLADRYRTHVEIPRLSPESLPIIAPLDRKLPKLAKAQYAAFYKYLRANLPEIKDIGEDFPSPERFEAYGFKHLHFTLVGGGRMVIVHGPSAEGLHAFWLSKSGFEKSAFWPCDSFPEPMLRPGKDDKIEILLSVSGETRAFEMLYWGL